MNDELQFDRVAVGGPAAEGQSTPAVVCAGCQTRLETDYYEINGRPFCGSCRGQIETLAETPRGLLPFAIAAVFGLGAALAGAAIYYAVVAVTHFEIGLVAILIGYMVGYAVRKGAGGRGGLRFQILAAVLTYAAVGVAYTVLAVRADIDRNRVTQAKPAQALPDSPTQELADRSGTSNSGRPLVLALAYTVVFVAVVPVLVIVGSMPSGLINALIIFFGIRQAMRMTAAPVLRISGPFRIGTTPSAPSAPSAPSPA
jgi:hypothetical protein